MRWLGFQPDLVRTIVKLAAPVTLAMLTQTAINLVDTIMVGRLPADYSIAGQSAIGYSLILLWGVGGFLSCIQVGTQAITARRYGEGDTEGAGRALSNSLVIAVVFGSIATLAAALNMHRVFPYLDSNPRVVELGSEYATYRMIGVLSMVATASYKAFFDGIGKTYVHMMAAIVMNLANLLLNWVLIFGVGPFPQMNVEGAGLGSLISTYIGLAMMMLWSFNPGDLKRFGYYRLGNFDWAVVRKIVRVSVPSGFATLFVMSGFAIFIVIVGLIDQRTTLEPLLTFELYRDGGYQLMNSFSQLPLGTSPLFIEAFDRPPIFTSATKIIMDILSLSFMTMIALGTATATLVGQSLGAGKPDLASRYGWQSVRLGLSLMVLFATAAIVWPEWFVAVFNPDPDVIAAGVAPLRLMAVSSLAIAVGMVLAQALFGAGCTRYVMWVEAILHLVCFVPLSYWIGVEWELGLLGVWSAVAIYIALLAAAMVWKFREGGWKEVAL